MNIGTSIDSLFPHLRTNLFRAAHWDYVMIQPRQRMEIRAIDIFKYVLFYLIGPQEPNIWLSKCMVALIFLFVNIDSLFPYIRTTLLCTAHWDDAMI